MFFGAASPFFLLEILIRTSIIYVYTLVLLRWLGSRTIGQLSTIEFLLVAAAYWVGEAMGEIDFVDLKKVPDKVTQTIGTLARNTAHLARFLKANAYPGEG